MAIEIEIGSVVQLKSEFPPGHRDGQKYTIACRHELDSPRRNKYHLFREGQEPSCETWPFGDRCKFACWQVSDSDIERVVDMTSTTLTSKKLEDMYNSVMMSSIDTFGPICPDWSTYRYAYSTEMFSKEKIIKTKKSYMSNLIEKFRIMRLGEPEKTFVKAGIAHSNGELTNEGWDLFKNFLLSKFGAEFKTEVVDKIVAECAKDKEVCG